MNVIDARNAQHFINKFYKHKFENLPIKSKILDDIKRTNADSQITKQPNTIRTPN